MRLTDGLRVGAFAAACGDRERRVDSIDGLPELCRERRIGINIGALGCASFYQMTQPLEVYLVESARSTLSAGGVSPQEVRYVVFATSDGSIGALSERVVRCTLTQVGLRCCVPVLVSLQQCVSSLAALQYGCELMRDDDVGNVLIIAFDLVERDQDRVKPFALQGDAVASCLVSRDGPATLTPLSYAVRVDPAGVIGEDSFESRKQAAVATLSQALADAGGTLDRVERCFSTNLYKPLAWFNASTIGLSRSRLSIDTLPTHAHCGNCDWMLNAMHHRDQVGFAPGRDYVVQGFAPGFVACGVLRGV